MPPTFWQLAGLKNFNHRGGDMPLIAEKGYQAGFRAVLVQVHQGTDPRNSAGYEVPAAYTDMWRDMGYKVAVWGWLTAEDPVGEAELAARMTELHAADAYVANAELPHKYSQPNGFCPPCFESSRTFVREFRQWNPTVTLGLSTYAKPADHDIWWGAWLNEGNARILPQTYTNMFGPRMRPVESYRASIDVKQPWNPMIHPVTKQTIAGFPHSYWHPQLGNWGKGGEVPDWNTIFHTVETGARMNVTELLEAKQAWPGFYGFHVATAEHQTPESLAIYGEAIRKGCALT